MSVYIGPCNYGTDEGEPPSQGNPFEIDGDLDYYRIVNLRHSGESRPDAATVGIVSDWVGALNAKVDSGGGTMTGDLIMGGNKIK